MFQVRSAELKRALYEEFHVYIGVSFVLRFSFSMDMGCRREYGLLTALVAVCRSSYEKGKTRYDATLDGDGVRSRMRSRGLLRCAEIVWSVALVAVM